ncbi:LOW QUALITY PROTEIN: Hypothetical protein PHPALM_6905 [Phytophthora palmivora]|uniref:Uncharacterized protein n=1 Tax=Phytophthora palmivora TaxID=4796 RepID=A0A2P4YDP2_9STRA|nr:LOW QUALITY PROTEIN: Hypothetical protein PHPALM_6905 [Phytophthora palmivora]
MAGFTIPDQDDPPPPRAEEPEVEEEVAAEDTRRIGETGAAASLAAPSATERPEAAMSGRGRPRCPSTHLNVNNGEPFALPRRNYEGDTDVDMEDISASADNGGQIPWTAAEQAHADNAYTPSPTNFPRLDNPRNKTFMKKYEAYCRQLSALETAFFRPFRMPVGSCVEDERRRHIAMFDICKPIDEITGADWIN